MSEIITPIEKLGGGTSGKTITSHVDLAHFTGSQSSGRIEAHNLTLSEPLSNFKTIILCGYTSSGYMTNMASHPIDVATLIYVFNTMNWNRYFVSFGTSGMISLQPESNGKYALDAFPGNTDVKGLAVLGFK